MRVPEHDWRRPAPAVDTGGGAYITGGTQAQGGTFIGRDQVGHETVQNLNVTYLITGDRQNSLEAGSTLGMEVFEQLGSQQQQLRQAGVESGIAVATPPGNLLTQMTQP